MSWRLDYFRIADKPEISGENGVSALIGAISAAMYFRYSKWSVGATTVANLSRLMIHH